MLGLVGAVGAGAALAPTLQIVTIPIGIVGGAFLLRAWWLQLAHGATGAWLLRSLVVLALSTALSAMLWSLRFAGILGLRETGRLRKAPRVTQITVRAHPHRYAEIRKHSEVNA